MDSLQQEDRLDMTKHELTETMGNLKPSMIKGMFEQTLGHYIFTPGEEQSLPYKLLLLTVDSPWLKLHASKQTRAHAINIKGTPQARMSIFYDLENGYCVADALISFTEPDEQVLLIENLKNLKARGCDLSKILLIADKDYQSFSLFKELDAMGVHYLVRGKELESCFSPLSEVDAGDLTQQRNGISIRCVKVKQEELAYSAIIYTNAMTLSVKEIAEIFDLRWKDERLYPLTKSLFKTEEIKGNTLILVEQEFWATMTIGNIMGGFEREATNYSVDHTEENNQITFSMLKQKLVEIFIDASPEEGIQIFHSLFDQIQHYWIIHYSERTKR